MQSSRSILKSSAIRSHTAGPGNPFRDPFRLRSHNSAIPAVDIRKTSSELLESDSFQSGTEDLEEFTGTA